jgi:hypothetical protein
VKSWILQLSHDIFVRAGLKTCPYVPFWPLLP